MAAAPDILFLVSERHRRDFTGHAGASLAHTPNIDRLAARGIWFDKAATVFPQAEPAYEALLSGCYPRVDAAGTTLAESPMGSAFGAAGYDLMEIRAEETAAATAARAVDAMARRRAGPRLMLVRFPALDHLAPLPEEAFAAYRGTGVPLAAQHAAATACDMAVGTILEALKQSAAAQNTAILYTSLVGDQFRYRDAANRTNTCHDECIRVPLVLCLPAAMAPCGVRLDQLVGLHDILPTLCALAGAAPPATDGNNLVPLMSGKDGTWRKALFLRNRQLRHIAVGYYPDAAKFTEYDGWDQYAVWDGRRKLILSADGGRHSLYDTGFDPEEEFDLFGAPRWTPHADLMRFRDTTDLLQTMASHLEACARQAGDTTAAALARQIRIDPDTKHQPKGRRLERPQGGVHA